MKKTLLLTSSLLFGLCFGNATEVLKFDNAYFHGVAPDGSLAVSYLDGNAGLINPKTGQIIGAYGASEDGSSYYGESLGNCVSNTGIALGTTSMSVNAAYWKGGEWFVLPTTHPEMTNTSEGITPDGLFICGSVGMAEISLEDTDTPMLLPAVWELQPDGTYGEPTLLPHPDYDLTGRVPQYITAISISANGKVIVGQLQDYSGILPQPIVYTKSDDGTWSYTLPAQHLLNPNNITLPEYPGDSPQQPQPTDFMTEEEKAAYDAAYNEWYENVWELGNWDDAPNVEDFMTDDEKAAYQAALAEWQTQYENWQTLYDAWNAEWELIIQDATKFVFNNCYITPDGKTLLTTHSIDEDDPMSWMGYKTVYGASTIDLTTGDIKLYPANEFLCSQILENGTILGSIRDNQLGTVRAALIMPGEEEFTYLDEYVQTADPEIYDSMKELMQVDIMAWDPETGDDVVYENIWITGVPFASSDMSIVTTSVFNSFNFDDPASAYGYVLSLNGLAKVDNLADAGEFAVKALKDGRVMLKGDVESLAVYDASGREVFRTDAPADVVETGLNGGAFIIKAVAADGSSKVVKAIF